MANIPEAKRNYGIHDGGGYGKDYNIQVNFLFFYILLVNVSLSVYYGDLLMGQGVYPLWNTCNRQDIFFESVPFFLIAI